MNIGKAYEYGSINSLNNAMNQTIYKIFFNLAMSFSTRCYNFVQSVFNKNKV